MQYYDLKRHLLELGFIKQYKTKEAGQVVTLIGLDDGIVRFAKRFERLAKQLEKMGLSPQRFRVEWISAAEGAKYAQVIREMDETLHSFTLEEIKEENERIRPALERRLRRLPEIPQVAEALELAEKVPVMG